MKIEGISLRLIDLQAWESVLPIFKTINPSFTKKQTSDLLKEMFSQGYRCAVAYHETRCVGVIGIWIQTKFYIGRHVEYDNFYVLPGYRRKGVGKMMLAFVNAFALEQGCLTAELKCDILEKKSQEFWEKLAFKTIGYCYQKSLVDLPAVTRLRPFLHKETND